MSHGQSCRLVAAEAHQHCARRKDFSTEWVTQTPVPGFSHLFPPTPIPSWPARMLLLQTTVGGWTACTDMALPGDSRPHDIAAVQCARKWSRSGILAIDCDRRYHATIDCDHDRDREQLYWQSIQWDIKRCQFCYRKEVSVGLNNNDKAHFRHQVVSAAVLC